MTARNLEEALAPATYAPGGESVWVVASPGLDQPVPEDPRLTEVHSIAVDYPLEGRELASQLRGTWASSEVTAPTPPSSRHLYRVDRHPRR